jgi:hypothetical protein
MNKRAYTKRFKHLCAKFDDWRQRLHCDEPQCCCDVPRNEVRKLK